MNMQIFKTLIQGWDIRKMRVLALSLLTLLMTSCTETSTVYEIEAVDVGVNDEAKTKAKRERQFIQALYNHIYQAPLPPAEGVAIDEIIRSIGDRQVAIELVVAKMVVDQRSQLPPRSQLRQDPSAFIGALYQRFYVREATQAELSWWTNYLETHPEVDVAQVVYAFVTANEYRYY